MGMKKVLKKELTNQDESVEYASVDQAGIAQLVEHNLAKVGVASSNLVSRSRFQKPGLFERKDRVFHF